MLSTPMKNINLTSACRYCRYYQPEGRRGGCCQLLGVPVQGSWKACTLSHPTFTVAWKVPEVMIVPNEPALVPTSSLLSKSNHTLLEPNLHSLSLTPS